jgi:hypothetical protein
MGMPSPAFALKGRTADPGVTNVRDTSSPHWRRWLGPANLTDENEVDVWFNAPTPVAMEMQTPLPAGKLRIIAHDARQDRG